MATGDWTTLVGYAQAAANRANQLANTNLDNAFSQGYWPYAIWGPNSPKLVSKSKTVSKMIKEDFAGLSSKPIVKEIMAGLIKLKKDQVSLVVNEMLAI